MNKFLASFIVLIVLAAGVYFVVGRSDQPGAEGSPTDYGAQRTNIEVSVPTSKTHSVLIQSFAFSEKSLTIKKGETVVWSNKDSAPHTVTGAAGGPASATLNSGGAYSFTFNTAGTFEYHCAFHPSMKGTIIVTP